MTFLHPWALSLAALASVPILLHLLRRDTKRKILFPALRYLEEARRRHARSVRLRDRLLLAVRVLLVASVALAASGPLVGRGGPGAHRPTDVAILVDNSASMAGASGERTFFDAATDLATVTLAEGGPDDRFWIWPAVGPAAAENVRAAEAREALGRIGQTDAAGSVLEAARRAVAALPPRSDRPRELQLLTDLQAAGFDGAPLVGFPAVDLVLGGVGAAPAPNGAVVALTLDAARTASVGNEARLTVESRRFLDDPAVDSLESEPMLRLEIDGTTVALAAGTWDGQTVFALPTLRQGSHAGRVSLPPSGLSADDARSFVLEIGPPPLVGFRGPSDGFLARAIESLDAAGRLRVRRAGASSGIHEQIRVVEGGGIGRLDPREGAPHDLILVPPADPLSLPRFAQGLAEVGIPWRLRAEPARGDLRLADADAFPGAADVRISARFALEKLDGGPAPDTAVVLRTEDGRPWLVRGRVGGVAFLLLASPLVPEAGNLVLRPAMIPFVEALLLRWAPSASRVGGALEAGRTWRLPGDADSVRLPDGRVLRTDGGAPFTPLRAGVHEIYAGHASAPRVELLAVNTPRSESGVRMLDRAGVEARFPGRGLRWATEGEAAWRAAIYGARRGRGVTVPFLVLALLLAAAEMGLAAPGRRTRHGGDRRATA